MTGIEITSSSNFIVQEPFEDFLFIFDDLDKEITYGSNSYAIDQKPSGMRDIYVKGEDIELIQEAKIVLDNH